jgi:hypothetical protein
MRLIADSSACMRFAKIPRVCRMQARSWERRSVNAPPSRDVFRNTNRGNGAVRFMVRKPWATPRQRSFFRMSAQMQREPAETGTAHDRDRPRHA